MVDKTEMEQTPLSDVKFDAEGVAALLALLSNMANQGTGGSTAGVAGNTNQLGAGANASEVSIQSMADINVPESMNGYVGLALNNATSHQNRLQLMGEQILQNAITESKQITQNAITQANSVVTDSTSQRNKREVDQGTIADFLHFQGLRNEALATDRIWNIDEQVAAAEALYAALGRFITSSKVENPA
jgi:cell division septum initiation protein DivIVA